MRFSLGLRRAGAAGRPAGRAALGLRRAGAAGRPAGRGALGLRRAPWGHKESDMTE